MKELEPCFHENIINSADSRLKVGVVDADDDVELARALVDHTDVDLRMRQR